MKTSEVLQALRDSFFERLEKHTGWGKEQVKKEYNESVEEILFNLLEKEE